jgi:hypothetical protein
MLEGSVDSAEDPMLEREEVLTPMDSIFWDRKNPCCLRLTVRVALKELHLLLETSLDAVRNMLW